MQVQNGNVGRGVNIEERADGRREVLAGQAGLPLQQDGQLVIAVGRQVNVADGRCRGPAEKVGGPEVVGAHHAGAGSRSGGRLREQRVAQARQRVRGEQRRGAGAEVDGVADGETLDDAG